MMLFNRGRQPWSWCASVQQATLSLMNYIWSQAHSKSTSSIENLRDTPGSGLLTADMQGVHACVAPPPPCRALYGISSCWNRVCPHPKTDTGRSTLNMQGPHSKPFYRYRCQVCWGWRGQTVSGERGPDSDCFPGGSLLLDVKWNWKESKGETFFFFELGDGWERAVCQDAKQNVWRKGRRLCVLWMDHLSLLVPGKPMPVPCLI